MKRGDWLGNPREHSQAGTGRVSLSQYGAKGGDTGWLMRKSLSQAVYMLEKQGSSFFWVLVYARAPL